MTEIGKNIKKIRTVKNLNQQDLANILGLSRASIGAYEELRAEPKLDSLIKLASHYNLDLGRLINTPLTVNEIHGFKQREQYIFEDQETLQKPVKLRSFDYYTLKNNLLRLQKSKVKWPTQATEDGLALQTSKEKCLLFFTESVENLIANEDIIYKKENVLYHDYLIGIGKTELKCKNTTLNLNLKNLVLMQPKQSTSNLEHRLTRLEKLMVDQSSL